MAENTKEIETIEEVALLDATDRVLAEEIQSPFNVPPFRRAAMDGYAVKAATIADASESTPIVLNNIEKVLAGDVSQSELGDFDCIEIATGAMMPDSADTVVQVEMTSANENQISIIKALTEGTNVSKAAADIGQGETILHIGEILTPARIGVLAALNITKASVYRKPIVAIIPTGREIAPLGNIATDGQIYDINSYTLFTLIQQRGGTPLLFPIIPDEYSDLETAILDASQQADLVIIIGGSSVGERDINIEILSQHGTILFHGVKIKPGKPTIAALVNDRLVINLPGFPTSCLTNGYVIMLPVMRKMAHLPYNERIVKGILGQRVFPAQGRDLLLTVRMEKDRVYPTFKESGTITSIAMADGFIVVPADIEYLEIESVVEVHLF